MLKFQRPIEETFLILTGSRGTQLDTLVNSSYAMKSRHDIVAFVDIFLTDKTLNGIIA